MMNLFAHFLDTIANDEENDIVVVAHYTEYNEQLNKSCLHIKYNSKDGTRVGMVMDTNYYSDPWLTYIESIFMLNGNNGFDFSNFDQERERK